MGKRTKTLNKWTLVSHVSMSYSEAHPLWTEARCLADEEEMLLDQHSPMWVTHIGLRVKRHLSQIV